LAAAHQRPSGVPHHQESTLLYTHRGRHPHYHHGRMTFRSPSATAQTRLDCRCGTTARKFGELENAGRTTKRKMPKPSMCPSMTWRTWRSSLSGVTKRRSHARTALTTDIAPGYDHITSGIGAAISTACADLLRHAQGNNLCLLNKKDVKDGASSPISNRRQ